MTDYTRVLLSGSTNGTPIPVTATSISSGQTVHTAVAGTSSFDEVYLYANNTDTVNHNLTIGFGGESTGYIVSYQVVIYPNQPPVPILTGQNLQNGLNVYAAADVASKINLTGFVNRIQ